MSVPERGEPSTPRQEAPWKCRNRPALLGNKRGIGFGILITIVVGIYCYWWSYADVRGAEATIATARQRPT